MQFPDREAWTIRPGKSQATSGRETVIIVPPDTAIDAGLRRAEEELAKHDLVRVVGRGVTTSALPQWARAHDGLVLTEIDAYLPSDRQSSWKEIERDLRSWLHEVFADAIPGVAPEDALWGSASLRVFLPAFIAWPYVVGLAAHHASDNVICVDGSWIGVRALEARVLENGGTFEAPAPPTTRAYPLRVAVWGTITAAGALAYRAREFWNEGASRRKLHELRKANGKAPRVWLALFGDWPRSCRHVIQGVGAAAHARGERLGILLMSSLRPGLRRDDDMHAATGSTIFPALDEEPLRNCIGCVDQCASVESWSALALNGATSLARSARVFGRLIQRGPDVELGALRFDLGPCIAAVARLATFDVLRGNETARATRALLRRRSFDGTEVVFPHSSLTVEAIPDLLLQDDGATTYDFIHGSLFLGLDVQTFGRTNSTVEVLWTEAEAKLHARFTKHRRSVGGYVPKPKPAPRIERAGLANRPLHILATTNYSCPNPGVGKGLALAVWQDALIQAVMRAKDAVGGPVIVRWRPHPSDDRASVEATRARVGPSNFELSVERNALDRDLAWADVLVTSISSTITEALGYGLPIFVHEPPVLDPAGALSFFAPERRFRTSAELGDRLASSVEDLRSGAPTVLRFEEEVRRRFFGASGEPARIEELLWTAGSFA